MFGFPKLSNPSKLPLFFSKISDSPVPKRFTYRFLESLGFKSSKERELVIFMKTLSFIDEDGKPSEAYFELKDLNRAKAAVSKSTHKAYGPIFDLDTDAHLRSSEVLEGYFGRLMGIGKDDAQEHAETFKSLCEWSGLTSSIGEVKSEKKVGNRTSSRINLNITLPSTTDEKVYESLFKHLRDLMD